MINKDTNIDKLRELVEELTIRDYEIFKHKDFLELILENATDGYWDWHINDDYEFLSDTFKMQLGYKPDEMVNHPSSWQKIILKDDLDKMIIELNKHFESMGKYPFRIICRYKHKSNKIIKILCRGNVVEWDGDKPLRMVGTHIDVTDII